MAGGAAVSLLIRHDNAVGTAIVNSNVEAVLKSFEIPPFQVDQSGYTVFEGSAVITARDTANSTFRLRFGDTALGGSIVLGLAAAASAANTRYFWRCRIISRSPASSSSGAVYFDGYINRSTAASAGQTFIIGSELTGLNLTTAKHIAATMQWSAAQAGSSARGEAASLIYFDRP